MGTFERPLELVTATDKQLIMEDGHGAYSVIEFLDPDKPNVGLGYKLCPSGSQTQQFEHTLEAIETLCRAISSASLSEHEAKQALEQRLVPKLAYQLHLTSFSQQQCDQINSKVRRAFLPPMRINRHLPIAVAHGPLQYGGMMALDAYALQDQTQLPYIIRQLR